MMKRVILFISLFIVSSLLLAACGAEAPPPKPLKKKRPRLKHPLKKPPRLKKLKPKQRLRRGSRGRS